MPDDSSEPDKVYSSAPLSRRTALALGGTGLTAALAGCSEMLSPSSGSRDQNPSADEDNGNSESDEDEQPDLFVPVEIGGSETEFGIRVRTEYANLIADGGSVEYLVRVYSAPLFDSTDRTLLTEQTITKTASDETHTVQYEFPDDCLNYAQQLTFTLEVTSPDDGEEWEVAIPERRRERSEPNLDVVLLPFYNEARGETMVSVRGPPYPSQSEYSDEFEPLARTEVWFNEPDESLYNRPEYDYVTEDRYPKHWYGDWKDLQITMVVRYPVYEVMEDDDQNVPLYDWATFNFDITDIEMIEGRRWNSFVVQQIERGRYELSSDGQTATTPSGTVRDSHNSEGSLITAAEFYHGDISDTPTPFSEYYRSRYGDATTSSDNINANPIKVAAGRPVMKRWATEIEDSLANNPNFQEHDAHGYYKATIVKAIIGSSPYSFSVGSYMQTPEEVISNWYQNQNGSDALGGNCVDASALFCGIGVHLLDTTVGLLQVTGDNVAHVQACLFGRELPSYLPDAAHNRNATNSITSSSTDYEDRDYGKFMPVECNYAGATIGYVQRFDPDVYLSISSFASNIQINSHIPVNDDYLPDADGKILADREPPQNAFRFNSTITNPSEKPYFERQNA
ncbi:hypothetical protein SAMN05443574_101207 [Haloarcula vallismortis]|uniref:Uncharacterized protein n=1 Tax=Haloarcula vallismortis TaxID=28442 RepID=A0A1H2QFR8_HALVA|nr:hypothetical protein [Haloarcula vallismortis]SDW05750.1 hypothetical protein SAMN05443574_101207 [Haloarcula vallismortis]